MQLNDPRTDTAEFHGVVTLVPDKVGKKVIQALNRKIFLGKHIAVHEYHRRNWHNDPRLKMAKVGSERRLEDRRRKDVVVVADITEQFSSHKTFSRQYL